MCTWPFIHVFFFIFFLKFLFIHTFSETGPMSVGRQPAWVQSKADGGREGEREGCVKQKATVTHVAF